MGRPPSKNKAKKQQSQPADSDNFISRKAGDLSAFITAIYTLPPAQKALRTKILSFNAWADWPSHSDVRNGLGAMALKTGDNSVLKRANAALRAAVAKYGERDLVPQKEILDVYVDVLSRCANVQTIEIPAEWAGAFEWKEGQFLKVDRGSKKVVEGGRRIRWGPPVDLEQSEEESEEDEEAGEERGEGMEWVLFGYGVYGAASVLSGKSSALSL
ncbi:hypothetical protein BU26DRAFT_570736 [Trematosphaeria pertusa]|uniref:Uncharacterized protein n=1 Tax=Trematosphaeria pertusa TaxID=390896 RepID=A0A6A6HYH7_9PLEO|nr:uncharacterized protein BU26DRAFT_570736 [Trematosphaeria pertusa]KAF2242673.1 hypothetical protein BU26DRAFT_570736 [Trematosphaeria pertusa]